MTGTKYIVIGVVLLVLQALAILGSLKGGHDIGITFTTYGIAKAIGYYGTGIAGIALIRHGCKINSREVDEDED